MGVTPDDRVMRCSDLNSSMPAGGGVFSRGGVNRICCHEQTHTHALNDITIRSITFNKTFNDGPANILRPCEMNCLRAPQRLIAFANLLLLPCLLD